MSDHGHYRPPVNRPWTDERFGDTEDGPSTRPYLGVCPDCGEPNSAHRGTACPEDRDVR